MSSYIDMAENASTHLASHAAELSRAIYSALEKGRLRPSDSDSYRAAHDIAARLHLINTYLGSLPPYWITSDVEQLCHAILRDLEAIYRSTKRPLISSYFAHPFGRHDHTDTEACLVAFFKLQVKNGQSLKGACDDLLSKLTADGNDEEALPDSAIQHLVASDTSADFSDGIFKAFQLIAECDPASHETTSVAPAGERDSGMLWHPARLCLHELHNGQNLVSQHIRILVSAMNMAHWQEFYLKM